MKSVNVPVVLAEVLDKEPGLLSIWALYGGLALSGFFICRWKPWSFVAVGPIVTLLGWASLTELYDRNVGPAIFRESAPLFVQWNVAVGLAVFSPVAGFIAGLRHKRSRPA
jgi:hypothetical protein